MKIQSIALLAILLQTSACVVTPRIEIADSMHFDYVIPNQSPMSFNDIMCCYDCAV